MTPSSDEWRVLLHQRDEECARKNGYCFQGSMHLDSPYEQEYREQIELYLDGKSKRSREAPDSYFGFQTQYEEHFQVHLKQQRMKVYRMTEPEGWSDWGKHQKIHIQNGVKHNALNVPAMIYDDGRREYFMFGVRHRTDGPAIEGIVTDPHGMKHVINRWWFKGLYVSCRKPDGKYILKDGTITYWTDGILTNKDGPAVVYSDGTEEFYIDGWPAESLKQVLDGCITLKDGTKEYYYEGELVLRWRPELPKQIIKVEPPKHYELKKTKTGFQLFYKGLLTGTYHGTLNGKIVFRDCVSYWENGILHNDDGPAIIFPNCHREWYFAGEFIMADKCMC